MSYIEFQNITKEYNTGGNAIFALKDASFSVEKGELAIILGASGAGKTTALNILGGMDTATSGHVMGRRIRHHHLWKETVDPVPSDRYWLCDISKLHRFGSEPDRTGKCGIGFSDLQ